MLVPRRGKKVRFYPNCFRANRRHDDRMSSGDNVPCVDVLRAALTVHLTATGI
jgi:hypothetical protein